MHDVSYSHSDPYLIVDPLPHACSLYHVQLICASVDITSIIVWLLKAQNGSNPEKNGTKTILVSLEAEFFVEQHIQNPLKSAPGKSC